MKALILLPSLVLISTLPSAAQDWSLQTPPVKKAVFRLISEGGGGKGTCSGVLINDKDHVVMTAAHCVPEKEEGRSITVGGKHADVLKWNGILDLALLKVPDLGGDHLLLRPTDVDAGTPAMAGGYGFGAKTHKFGFGWVSDPHDDSLTPAGEEKIWFATTGATQGYSGGALVDAGGRLISIVQGYIAGGPLSLMYGAPRDTVKDFGKPHWPAN